MRWTGENSPSSRANETPRSLFCAQAKPVICTGQVSWLRIKSVGSTFPPVGSGIWSTLHRYSRGGGCGLDDQASSTFPFALRLEHPNENQVHVN